jgi:prepilin-type N-terminal cleavage/methylation domain-containing protein
MRRGFTLIELAAVLVVIGLLTVVTGPVYRLLVARARTLEARESLLAIAHAELTAFRDRGRFIACAPSAPAVPKGARGTFDASQAGWKDLGFAPEGPVWYRYEVRLDGRTFVAEARGDLDGDGVASSYSLRGDDLRIVARDELQ